MASLSFKFDERGLDKQIRATLLKKSEGVVSKELLKRAQRVRDEARRNAVNDTSDQRTGRLANSIRMTPEFDVVGTDWVTRQVGSSLPYARWVEEGTGIYGPHRTPIVPTRAQFLKVPLRVFRRSGSYVLVRSVKGQPGLHYLGRAVEAVLLP